MRKILCMTTTIACFAVAGLFGCAEKVSEEDISSPQDDAAAKAEMEKAAQDMQAEMQKMQQEMQRRRGPG
jgi:hypothetical protein